jgi:hypothetical protein
VKLNEFNQLPIYQLKHWIEALKISKKYRLLIPFYPDADNHLIETLENVLEDKENNEIICGN